MSETVVKLGGLSSMVVSVFMVVFGLYTPQTGSWLSRLLVWGGVLLFITGSICYVVYRKD